MNNNNQVVPVDYAAAEARVAAFMMNNSNEVVPFQFGLFEVRTVVIDGEPWFVAGDVCECLGLNDHNQSTRYLDDDEKGMFSLQTPGGIQRNVCVNEPGLYSLILRSRKTEAKRFKRWVTHEVLPTIRKTGQYSVAQPLTREEQLAQACLLANQVIAELSEKNTALEMQTDILSGDLMEAKEELAVTKHKVIQDAPYVDYAKDVAESKGALNLTSTAKSFGLQPNKFIEFLRVTGRIYKDDRDNLPIQEYVNNGVFKTRPFAHKGGMATQTLVTGKGQDVLRKFVRKHQESGRYRHLI